MAKVPTAMNLRDSYFESMTVQYHTRHGLEHFPFIPTVLHLTWTGPTSNIIRRLYRERTPKVSRWYQTKLQMAWTKWTLNSITPWYYVSDQADSRSAHAWSIFIMLAHYRCHGDSQRIHLKKSTLCLDTFPPHQDQGVIDMNGISIIRSYWTTMPVQLADTIGL